MLVRETRAMYYPQLLLQQTETRFGSMKLLSPVNPYEVPLPVHTKKLLIRCDKLRCFVSLWGEGISVARNNLYTLVSGDSSDETYIGILCSYYKTHSEFARYIDNIVFYGNQSQPLIVRITRAFRDELNVYKSKLDGILFSSYGTKFLLDNNEYLYYAVDTVPKEITDMGVCLIS